MTELLVATRKGLFVLRGDPHAGRPFEIVTRAFPGDVVEFAMRDPRTGRYFAGHTSGFYGPRLMFTDDLAGEWTQAEGPAFPEDGETTLERIWMIRPGEADGLLYAGVAPAALFVSTDGGGSWSLNEPLWKERQAGDWQPGSHRSDTGPTDEVRGCNLHGALLDRGLAVGVHVFVSSFVRL